MTYRNADLLHVIHQIPCVWCGAHGVQAAHSNLAEHGKGRSIKASDAAIMALCPACHRELDQGASLQKEERHLLTYRFIANTYIELVERGFLTVLRGRG